MFGTFVVWKRNKAAFSHKKGFFFLYPIIDVAGAEVVLGSPHFHFWEWICFNNGNVKANSKQEDIYKGDWRTSEWSGDGPKRRKQRSTEISVMVHGYDNDTHPSTCLKMQNRLQIQTWRQKIKRICSAQATMSARNVSNLQKRGLT